MRITLRPYQRECIEAIQKAEVEGVRRQLVSLPTGTGKTLIFSELIARRPGRSIVLLHRDELLRQAYDKLLMIAPDVQIGVVKANQDETDAPVVMASVQTLARARRLQRLTPDFKTVIIDACHHVRGTGTRDGNSYARILDHLRAFQSDGPLTMGIRQPPTAVITTASAACLSESSISGHCGR
jgi:superfamily II DNA or RNA helicase